MKIRAVSSSSIAGLLSHNSKLCLLLSSEFLLHTVINIVCLKDGFGMDRGPLHSAANAGKSKAPSASWQMQKHQDGGGESGIEKRCGADRGSVDR